MFVLPPLGYRYKKTIREEQKSNLLGTLLMALSGRRTRTVRTAEKLTFCRSSEYSSILQGRQGRVSRVFGIIKRCKSNCMPTAH